MEFEALKKSLGWLMKYQAVYYFYHKDQFIEKYINNPEYIMSSNEDHESCLEYYIINCLLCVHEMELILDEMESKGFVFTATNDLMTMCCIALNLLTNIFMEYDRRIDKSLNMNDFYYMSPDLQEVSKLMYHGSILKENINSYCDDKEEVIKLKTELNAMNNLLILRYAKSNVSMIKVYLLLFIIIVSPYYDEDMNCIAETILIHLRKLLYNKRIQGVFFPEYIYCDELNRSRTTSKLEIFFSMGNSDRYCVRLDFPHKGIDYIHLNINEPGKKQSTGFPLCINEIDDVVLMCEGKENFDKLFYLSDGLYWFKSSYEKTVCTIGNDDMEMAKRLFKFKSSRRHINIAAETDKHKINKFISAFSSSVIEYNIARLPYHILGEIENKIFDYILFEDYIYHMLMAMETLIMHKELLNEDISVEIINDLLREELLKYMKKRLSHDKDFFELYEISKSEKVSDIIDLCLAIIDDVTTKFEKKVRFYLVAV